MIRRAFGWQLGYGFSTTLAVVWAAPAVHAQAPADQHDYNLPAQDLGRSLRAVAKASGRNVMAATELIQSKIAPPLRGRFSATDAIAHLLTGSGLHVRTVGQDIIIERDTAPPSEASQRDGSSSDIVVTGSRIRGAPIASPVITISREEIQNSGQSGLGEVVRSIPQSFGGGQNPGVGSNVPSASGVNVGGGSSINYERAARRFCSAANVHGVRSRNSESRRACRWWRPPAKPIRGCRIAL
jgi:hypothetical protein